MLWTLCSALYLAASQRVQQLQGVLPEQYVQVQRVTDLVKSVVLGGVLAGAFVLGWNRVRTGPPLLSQPGHWLLMSTALGLIYVPLSYVILQWDPKGSSQTASLTLYGAIHLLPAAICFHATFRNTLWRWKSMFAALGSLHVLHVLALGSWVLARGPYLRWFAAFSVVVNLGPMILSLWLIVLMVQDLVAAERRDWLHWIGVMAFVVNANLGLLWLVIPRLLSGIAWAPSS